MAISRYKEGRNFETRRSESVTFGRSQKMTFSIFYNFPKNKMPPGMMYCWANFDNINLVELLDRGYKLVPSSRHPEYIGHSFGIEAPRYIYKGKQVLVEIPIEVYQRLRQDKVDSLNNEHARAESTNTYGRHNETMGLQSSALRGGVPPGMSNYLSPMMPPTPFITI